MPWFISMWPFGLLYQSLFGGFMKSVTIENVKARIAALEGADQLIGLGLQGEFELACLRQLLASLEAEPVAYSLIFRNMDGVLNDYVNANTTFPTIEKAQAYGRGGSYVRQNDGSLQWVPEPSLDPVVVPLFTAPPAPVSVPSDVMAAMQKVARIRLDLNDFDGDKRGILDCLSDAEEALIEVVNRRAAMLQGAEQSPATDNTAQQFESLTTSAQRETAAVVKHYTGEKYPTLKFAQDEWFIIGNRDNAQELADAINALATSAGSGKP